MVTMPLAEKPPHIRRATAADLPRVVELLRQDALGRTPDDPGPPLPEGYLAAFRAIDADPDNLLLVAEVDGEVVGTLQLTLIQYLVNRGARVAQVEGVRVAEGRRGAGLGGAMMRWAIDEARRRGCDRLQLTSNKQRSAAHRFYERLGFVRSHEGMKLMLR